MLFIILLSSYFIGSINFSVIICHILNLPSPLHSGSNNPGATNVSRVGGKKVGLMTFIGDASKGYFPIIIAKILALPIIELSYIGLLIIVGHMFSVFLKFKGGKGISTLIGILSALYWPLGLIFLISWIITYLATKYSSLSSLISTLVILSVISIFKITIIVPFLLITILIFIRHWENIKRLILKKENKI